MSGAAFDLTFLNGGAAGGAGTSNRRHWRAHNFGECCTTDHALGLGGENFKQGVVMRRLLCVGAALFALGVGTASAADLPIWTTGRTGVVLLPFTWTGPYFGLNIGGQITSDPTSTMSSGPGFFPGEAQALDAQSPGTLTSSGAIGGMQAGYNWQFDKAVVGLEVDFEGATATGNRAVIGIPNSPAGTALTQTNWVTPTTTRS
jgi:outer membrane immunogenic protein